MHFYLFFWSSKSGNISIDFDKTMATSTRRPQRYDPIRQQHLLRAPLVFVSVHSLPLECRWGAHSQYHKEVILLYYKFAFHKFVINGLIFTVQSVETSMKGMFLILNPIYLPSNNNINIIIRRESFCHCSNIHSLLHNQKKIKIWPAALIFYWMSFD